MSTHVTELIVAARRDEFQEIESAITSQLDAAIPNGSGATAFGASSFSFFHPATSPPPRLSLQLVEGGDSRQHSVANAVRVARGDFVLVHDAARPLVSPDLIERVLQAALCHDSAIAALPVCDTVKVVSASPLDLTSQSQGDAAKNGQPHEASSPASLIRETLDRSLVYLAQTPQIFRREILDEAFGQAARDNFQGTDCSSLVERLRDQNGARRFAVALVAGDERNFKITFAADLERAAALLQDAKT